MRTLTDHIVPGDSANNQLTITVTDSPGAGGANHRYTIEGFDYSGNISVLKYETLIKTRTDVIFQNGPIKECGVNGVTHEALAAILIDRLNSFQNGPFACDENKEALICFTVGLNILKSRTVKRIARNVEGTHQQ